MSPKALDRFRLPLIRPSATKPPACRATQALAFCMKCIEAGQWRTQLGHYSELQRLYAAQKRSITCIPSQQAVFVVGQGISYVVAIGMPEQTQCLPWQYAASPQSRWACGRASARALVHAATSRSGCPPRWPPIGLCLSPAPPPGHTMQDIRHLGMVLPTMSLNHGMVNWLTHIMCGSF